ncbi:MAG: hypothetical protein N4A72_15825 [Bacteroidales bacterium]|jgi:hypothetical protein|nr:hypothetical protein [Bacteroidales bacterium]
MEKISLQVIQNELSCFENDFEKIGVLHFSIVGSFVYSNSLESNDIDLYIILDNISLEKYIKIISTIHRLCYNLRERTNADWFVETQRGPFKNATKDIGQIHLLIEDSKSIEYMSSINILNWINNGKTIFGNDLIKFIDYYHACSCSLRSGIVELILMVDSLKNEYIGYKSWSFNKEIKLNFYKKDRLNLSEIDSLIQFTLKTGIIIYLTALNPNYTINSQKEIYDHYYDQGYKEFNKTTVIIFLESLINKLYKYESEKRTSAILAG